MERRSFLLLGAAALGLSGCTFGDPDRADPTAPGPTRPPADEDADVRASVAASEVALIASYRSAIEVAPDLAERLEPLLAHHVAHLARIAPGAGIPTPAASTSGSAASGASPSAAASAAPSAPRSALATVEALAEAESQALTQRTAACDGAVAAGLARDLCLVAASEAQHAEVLARLARTLDP